MAEANPPQDQSQTIEIEEERLKYLEFVQVAALHALVYASKLYGYAKDNSGPLKPGVETVEDTVKTVVGPVYDKYHEVPVGLLKFVDSKVDESVNKLDSQVPLIVKKVSTRALSAAKTAPAAARAVASEVKSGNVVETASGLAKTAYTKYEPVAEQYAVSAWRSLNQLPFFPRVAQVVVPTAAYCSEKYNQTVKDTAKKGYKVSSYLPLVPTEKISRVFAGEAAAH
ncbi:hypothetical protein LguiA_007970 [Lonicera macranthoides]